IGTRREHHTVLKPESDAGLTAQRSAAKTSTPITRDQLDGFTHRAVINSGLKKTGLGLVISATRGDHRRQCEAHMYW
ncbi:hypothetical protein ACC736_40190, partial [Rhizobium ruizarguesonis]